jgi:hypothetical protein
MNRWHDLITRTLGTAGPAAAATTAAVAVCGRTEDGNPVAPLNAISHILWGDKAAEQEDADVEHTVAGVALNTAAITGWAGVYELVFGRRARQGDVATAVIGGAAVAGLAYVVDYYVVPKRFTPGFEKRLSPASMLAVYATLAVSLPVAGLIESQLGSDRRS